MKALAAAMLEHDEGRRRMLYRCTAGYLTIGVGHNIEANGLPDHIIDALLEYGIEVAARDLDALVPSWRSADPARQAALLSWSFQLGRKGMATFKNTLPHLRNQRWSSAAANLRRSKWATRDSPNRARRIIGQLETGRVDPQYPQNVLRAAADITAAVDARA